MARDGNAYDTMFNPNIAALGMPQANEPSVVGKSIMDFGKVLQDSEDAELKRKALNTNIAESEQRMDFASKLMLKQLEEADLKIAGQTTTNKANELQYKSADELWRDKKATDYLQSYIKSNGLKQEDLPTMLKNREQNPDQFRYKDHTGAEYDLSPNHITSAFDAINKQDLERKAAKAGIKHTQSQTAENYASIDYKNKQIQFERERLEYAKGVKEVKPLSEEDSKVAESLPQLSARVQNLLPGKFDADGKYQPPAGTIGTWFNDRSPDSLGNALMLSFGSKTKQDFIKDQNALADLLVATGRYGGNTDSVRLNTRKALLTAGKSYPTVLSGYIGNATERAEAVLSQNPYLHPDIKKTMQENISTLQAIQKQLIAPTEAKTKQEKTLVDTSLIDARPALNQQNKSKLSDGSKDSIIDRVGRYHK